MDNNIGVLGGGISGLTFSSMVPNTHILEKQSSPGGLMRSFVDQGYTFDIGSHILFSKNKAALQFVLDLLDENVIEHKRNTKIIYKGRQVKYPFENGLSDLPSQEAFDCANDYIETYIKREKNELSPPKNFGEWMLYRFGKSITDKYLFPYNQKVWDYPPEKMDLFWVEGRVPQPPLKDVLSSAMGLNSEGYTHQSNFFYPRVGGMQSIVDSISKKVPQITCNFDVKSVKKEDGLWFVSDSKKEYSFKKLVSTIHLGDLISCIKDAPKEVRSAAAGLKWNSMYLVFIGLKKPKVNDLHWTYIPDSDVLPNRLSFPSNLSPNSAPKGHSSVLAEITFDPNGPKSKLSLDEVVSKTIEDLHRINVFDKSDVVYSKAIKIKYAYVVYDLDYQKNISVLENYSKEQGITLLGRFSEFKYYNSDKCVESAMEKAKLFV